MQAGPNAHDILMDSIERDICSYIALLEEKTLKNTRVPSAYKHCGSHLPSSDLNDRTSSTARVFTTSPRTGEIEGTVKKLENTVRPLNSARKVLNPPRSTRF